MSKDIEASFAALFVLSQSEGEDNARQQAKLEAMKQALQKFAKRHRIDFTNQTMNGIPLSRWDERNQAFLNEYRSGNALDRWLLDPTGKRYREAVQWEAYQRCQKSFEALQAIDPTQPEGLKQWQQSYAELNYHYQQFILAEQQPKRLQKIDIQGRKRLVESGRRLRHALKRRTQKPSWWQRLWGKINNLGKKDAVTKRLAAYQTTLDWNRDVFIQKVTAAPDRIGDLTKELNKVVQPPTTPSVSEEISRDQKEQWETKIEEQYHAFTQTIGQIVTHMKAVTQIIKYQQACAMLVKQFEDEEFTSLPPLEAAYQQSCYACCEFALTQLFQLENPKDGIVLQELCNLQQTTLKQLHKAYQVRLKKLQPRKKIISASELEQDAETNTALQLAFTLLKRYVDHALARYHYKLTQRSFDQMLNLNQLPLELSTHLETIKRHLQTFQQHYQEHSDWQCIQADFQQLSREIPKLPNDEQQRRLPPSNEATLGMTLVIAPQTFEELIRHFQQHQQRQRPHLGNEVSYFLLKMDLDAVICVSQICVTGFKTLAAEVASIRDNYPQKEGQEMLQILVKHFKESAVIQETDKQVRQLWKQYQKKWSTDKWRIQYKKVIEELYQLIQSPLRNEAILFPNKQDEEQIQQELTKAWQDCQVYMEIWRDTIHSEVPTPPAKLNGKQLNLEEQRLPTQKTIIAGLISEEGFQEFKRWLSTLIDGQEDLIKNIKQILQVAQEVTEKEQAVLRLQKENEQKAQKLKKERKVFERERTAFLAAKGKLESQNNNNPGMNPTFFGQPDDQTQEKKKAADDSQINYSLFQHETLLDKKIKADLKKTRSKECLF